MKCVTEMKHSNTDIHVEKYIGQFRSDAWYLLS